jgi:hypothetical protein
MAGVFMFSGGTIWFRTRIMPRWFVWLTYSFGALLLFVAPTIRWVIIVFPFGVFLVSIFLIVSRRNPEFDTESQGKASNHRNAAE